MKIICGFVVMTQREAEAQACKLWDAEAHAADFAALLHHSETMRDMERDTNRSQRKRAFEAGKFHASGGYAHALKLYRAELQLLREVLDHYRARIDYWRPFIVALETVPGCLMRIDDWSDNMAPADFEAVGAEVAKERRRA